MLDIFWTQKPDNHIERFLVIDGEQISENVVSFEPYNRLYAFDDCDTEEGHWSITIKDERITEAILSHKLSELPPCLGQVKFSKGSRENRFEPPHLSRFYLRTDKMFVFCFELMAKTLEWNHPYSINDYIEGVKSVGETQYPGFYIMPYGLLIDAGTRFPSAEIIFGFPCDKKNETNSISAIINNFTHLCNQMHQETILSLSSGDKHSVEITLDLPAEIKVACEQYLQYFVQFLKDLGVEATSELKHEAEQVLFSITPKDKNQALDKIRYALEIYLQLPSSKVTTDSTEEYAIEIQRLVANVHCVFRANVNADSGAT